MRRNVPKENYAILRGMILEIDSDHRSARGKKRDERANRRVVVRMEELIERARMVIADMDVLYAEKRKSDEVRST